VKQFTAVVCLVTSVGLTLSAQVPAPQAPPPQFRAKVDLMRVDVTVLDKRTRRPVRGLTAADFEIRVGGTPQAIQAVAEAETGVRALTGPAWQTTAARDIITNDISASRLIVIVIDDSQGGPWHRKTGKKVAHAIVDGLGPDDLAAVVFVNRTDRSQDFTTDRTLLRAAIEAFDPLANSRWAAPDAPGTIRNVREFLARVPAYRRAIMVVTWLGYGCDGGTCAADPDWFWLRDVGILDTDYEGASDTVLAGSRLGHVPIHFFTTIGLQVGMGSGFRGAEDMLTLSRVAGGRAIVQHNAPELEVPAVMDEVSAMYALAYRPSFPLDGKLRYADVKVRRDDVIVMPSSGAFRTARERDAETQRTVTQSRGSGLLHAATSPQMAGALPLRASALAVAQPGAKEHPVVLTLGLPTSTVTGTSTHFLVRGFVYDGEGRRQLSTFEQRLSVSTGAQAHDLAEVVFRRELPPGRYNLRVAVEQASGQPDVPGPAGSAHLSVVVPDVAREPLSLSGIAVGRAEGRPIGGREVLSEVLPFAPTTVRTFATSDRVGALLRMHQGGRALVDAIVTTEIVNVADEVVATTTRTIAAAQFQSGAAVDHPYELPLKPLAAGEYLLRVTVVAGRHTAHRDVRFAVQR
jgi:VWFA-related protein